MGLGMWASLSFLLPPPRPPPGPEVPHPFLDLPDELNPLSCALTTLHISQMQFYNDF